MIRFTNSLELIDPKTNKISASLFTHPTEHFADYSTNLLGISQIEDALIKIKHSDRESYFAKDWCEKDGDVISPSDNEFEIVDTRGYFFLSIDRCHGHIVPNESEETNCGSITCQVKHTPKFCNFWHFSVRWHCDGVDTIYLDEKKRKKLLRFAARNFIIETAELVKPRFNAPSCKTFLR